MIIQKVLVPKDFIPMGQVGNSIRSVHIILKTPLQDEKLKLALETAGILRVAKLSYVKGLKCKYDASAFFDFHSEWIFTLCEMFPYFTMVYCFTFSESGHRIHHKLEFSSVVEYSVY